jgi:DNA repair exonuclease SbcCD ATPase subunit
MDLTNAQLKICPEYKQTKIDLCKGMIYHRNKNIEKDAIIKGLIEEINKLKNPPTLEVGTTTPVVNPPMPQGLPIILTEPEQELEEDKTSEIEGLWKINNELQQENEELKNNWSNSCNKYCKEIEELKMEITKLKEEIDILGKGNASYLDLLAGNEGTIDKIKILEEENETLKNKLKNIEAVMTGLRNLLTPGV